MTVHFIYSKEALLVKMKVNELRRAHRYDPKSAIVVEAESLSVERLQEHLRGGDLFASRTWLEVRAAVDWSGLDEKQIERYAAALAQAPQDAMVLVYQEGAVETINRIKPDGFLKIATQVKKKGPVFRHEVKPPEEKELPGWFQRLAADAGFEVSARVAEAVIEKVGGSLSDLSNAVQILDIVKTGSKRVNMEDIKYLPMSSEVEVWDILDRLWNGEVSEAIEILRRLESQGDAPEAVLGGLAFGVRQLYLARGRPLQYWEQRRFGDALALFDDKQFRRIVLFLGEADLRIKTTNEPGFNILEELLLKISAMRSGVR